MRVNILLTLLFLLTFYIGLKVFCKSKFYNLTDGGVKFWDSNYSEYYDYANDKIVNFNFRFYDTFFLKNYPPDSYNYEPVSFSANGDYIRYSFGSMNSNVFCRIGNVRSEETMPNITKWFSIFGRDEGTFFHSQEIEKITKDSLIVVRYQMITIGVNKGKIAKLKKIYLKKRKQNFKICPKLNCANCL